MKNYREVKIGPYSAYAIAKKNGFEGTEEEWLESLKPPAVDKTLTEEGQAADAKVTGDALERKAVIDDAAVGTDAWSGKHIIDTLCPPLDETGNPVVCYPVSGYPLGCKVSWEPTQEGSGEPSPENVRPIKGRDSVTVTRCGENLLNPSLFQNNKYQNFNAATNYYEISNSSGYWISGIQPCSPNTTYRFNKNIEGGCFYDEKKNVIGTVGFDFTFKTPAKCAYYCVNFSSGSTPYGTPVIATASKSTAPTTYAPYIGQTATLTLPRTIYGGTVDAVTGEGQETWKIYDNFNSHSINEGSTEAGWVQSEDAVAWYTSRLQPALNKQKVLSNVFHAISSIVTTAVPYTIGVNVNYVAFRLPRSVAATEDDVKRWLIANDVKIALEIKDQTPFTATGAQPIPAIPGVNTLMTDADSMAVTGRADPIKRITDLEDAVASMTTT